MRSCRWRMDNALAILDIQASDGILFITELGAGPAWLDPNIGPRSKPAMPSVKPAKFSIFSTLEHLAPGGAMIDHHHPESESGANQSRVSVQPVRRRR